MIQATANVALDYRPQPKQAMLHNCPANEVLYGGAAGPGKSHALRYDGLMLAMLIPGLQIYLFRRTYPELERNHILYILSEWGNRYGTWNSGKKRYVLPNGSVIHACHAQHERDVLLYHGAEIHYLIIDELTTFSEWQYVYLRNRVRCTLEIPARFQHKVPGIACGSNPGGPGHEFCKRTWVDFCRITAAQAEVAKATGMPVYEHRTHRDSTMIHYSVKQASRADGGMLRAYIPGLLQDNQILMDRDPGYIDRVRAMPEPYRSAYLDGDWEIFIGQAFNFSRAHHVCHDHPVPAYAPLYFTFDWGFAKPYSCGWWYVDADGRLYRFAELYGWSGTPDMGLRQTDSEIAEQVIAREVQLGLRNEAGQWTSRHIVRLSDPTCFNKKPDYKGGGQGPSTAEVWAAKDLILQPGDPSRQLKVRQFHERLRVPLDGAAPMLMVFESCKQFIRTIALLQQDEHDPEDVDTKMEDHVYDEAAHVCMARPMSLQLPKQKLNSYAQRIAALKRGDRDSYETYATIEAERTMRLLDGDDWDRLGEEDYYDDGHLVDTVD
jgi:hypothetical protein